MSSFDTLLGWAPYLLSSFFCSTFSLILSCPVFCPHSLLPFLSFLPTFPRPSVWETYETCSHTFVIILCCNLEAGGGAGGSCQIGFVYGLGRDPVMRLGVSTEGADLTWGADLTVDPVGGGSERSVTFCCL